VSAWCLRYIYTGVVSNETQEISLRPKHRNFVRSCGVLVTGTWYANTVTSASQHVSGNKWVSTWTCVANCFMSGHQTNFTTGKDVTQLTSGVRVACQSHIGRDKRFSTSTLFKYQCLRRRPLVFSVGGRGGRESAPRHGQGARRARGAGKQQPRAATLRRSLSCGRVQGSNLPPTGGFRDLNVDCLMFLELY